MRRKCRANIFTKVRMPVRTHHGEDLFTNFGRNRSANIFGTGCVDIFRDLRTDSFTNARLNFRTANLGANGYGGERIAAENIRWSFGMRNRLSRRTNCGTPRQNWRSQGGSREREMEGLRLFRF